MRQRLRETRDRPKRRLSLRENEPKEINESENIMNQVYK